MSIQLNLTNISLLFLSGGAFIVCSYYWLRRQIFRDVNLLVMNTLNDTKIQQQLKDTLVDACNEERVKSSINDLVLYSLRNGETQGEIQGQISDLIISQQTITDLNKLFVQLLQDEKNTKLLIDKVKSLLEDKEVQKDIHQIIIEILKDESITAQLYINIKSLLSEVMKDDDFNIIIVSFLSLTFMNALDEPVNEKFIKDKIIELTTSQEIMDSIANSIIGVVRRADIQKNIGDSAIASILPSLRKEYPKLTKWGVI